MQPENPFSDEAHAALNLRLHWENTRELYERYTVPLWKAMSRRINAGTYDEDAKRESRLLWSSACLEAARSYVKEHEPKWIAGTLFPPRVRQAVADEYREHVEREIVDCGNTIPEDPKTAPAAIIRLDAGQDINGNPRRVFICQNAAGEIIGASDESYYGDKVARRKWPLVPYGPTFKTTVKEYREIVKKWDA